MKEIIVAIKNFLRDRFNLNDDKAEENEIIEEIRRDVSFKGSNLWTLIFAILIASIGLNVNSTAVIIGAMLISPLMGPIMGIGLGIGINDFELLKKGIKNLSIAVIISILTSALYFTITPIHEANSELLARVNPSLWDVLIAFFGGMAGIVAGTRKKTSNVIPGVAIATALMPPLCTAGFSIATGNYLYFLGAIYLFFINSFFICLATFIIVKHLKFQKKHFAEKSYESKVIRYIWFIAMIMLLPSIYLAYKIVERSIFEGSAKSFVQKEFQFPRTQVVNRTFRMTGKQPVIDLLVIGEELSPATIDSLKGRLPVYGLDSVRLVIRQGLNARQEIDLAQIKASILEDVFNGNYSDTSGPRINKLELEIPDLRKELTVLFPGMKDYSLQQTIVIGLDSARNDTISLFTANFERPLANKMRTQLENWLKTRIGSDSVQVLAK